VSRAILDRQSEENDRASKSIMNKNPSKYLNSEIEYLEKVLNSENWSSTGGTWCQILEEQFSEKF